MQETSKKKIVKIESIHLYQILFSFHPYSSAAARIGGRLDVQC